MEILTFIYYGILILWYVLAIALIVYLYEHNHKPYPTKFNETYYQEIPSDLEPAELSVLLYEKVEPHVFTTTILTLIKKGAIGLKYANGDYHFRLIDAPGRIRLTRSESITREFLENIGKEGRFSLSELSAYCGTKKGDTEFLFFIDVWKNVSRREATKKHFFEERQGYNYVKIMKFFGILLIITNFLGGYHSIMGYATIVFIFVHPYLFSIFYRRTEHYNEEYMRWMAFANYLDHMNEFPKPSDVNSFTMSAIVLKKMNSLYEHNQNDKSIHFAYTLHQTITECYQHACFNGDRSITSLWKSK